MCVLVCVCVQGNIFKPFHSEYWKFNNTEIVGKCLWLSGQNVKNCLSLKIEHRIFILSLPFSHSTFPTLSFSSICYSSDFNGFIEEVQRYFELIWSILFGEKKEDETEDGKFKCLFRTFFSYFESGNHEFDFEWFEQSTFQTEANNILNTL